MPSCARAGCRPAALVNPGLVRHVTLALPRHGKLTQACRVVGDAIEALTQAWGQQLSPGPLSTSGLLGG